jgi:hypothetical protein
MNREGGEFKSDDCLAGNRWSGRSHRADNKIDCCLGRNCFCPVLAMSEGIFEPLLMPGLDRARYSNIQNTANCPRHGRFVPGWFKNIWERQYIAGARQEGPS